MDETEQRALAAREAKRSTRFTFAAVVLTVVVLMDAAVVAAVIRGEAPPTVLAAVVLTAVTLGLAAVMLAHAPGAEARRLAASPGRRDREQHKRAYRLAILSVYGLAGGALGAWGSAGILSGEPAFAPGTVAIWSALWGLGLPALVMGWDGAARRVKRYLEDELTRSFRDRAMMAGFWALLPGAVAAWLIGLWRPEWAVAALPLVMTIAGASATLRFALLHRAADRDE